MPKINLSSEKSLDSKFKRLLITSKKSSNLGQAKDN